MIRKSFRIGLKLGLIGAAIAVVLKLVQSRQAPEVVPTRPTPGAEPKWPPVDAGPVAKAEAVTTPPNAEPAPKLAAKPKPEPAPPVSRVGRQPMRAARTTKSASTGKQTWVEPNGDVCPSSHPVKAKLSSKIFHVLGGSSYDRTKADRCYESPKAAEADGLRAAKR